MNEDFWTMFPKEVEELDDSGEIRALIVSSTGPHFSAGIDLSMFKDDIVENETDNEMGRSRLNLICAIELFISTSNGFDIFFPRFG